MHFYEFCLNAIKGAVNKVQMLCCVLLIVFFDVTGLGAWDHVVNMRCKPYNKMQVSKVCVFSCFLNFKNTASVIISDNDRLALNGLEFSRSRPTAHCCVSVIILSAATHK